MNIVCGKLNHDKSKLKNVPFACNMEDKSSDI